jgi:hypothetical protein
MARRFRDTTTRSCCIVPKAVFVPSVAEGATNAQAALRYKRMARAWSELATEQDWLDGYPTQSDRAGELAADAIDCLLDQDASAADVKARKSRLIDGPVEFRKSRVDNC